MGLSLLQSAWADLNDETIGTESYWTIAVQNLSFWQCMSPTIAEFVAGNVLDMGAGRLAWRQALLARAQEYTSADAVRQHPALDVVADLADKLPWPDEHFSTIFCCSVLEHMLDFENALVEMRRILKSDGKLILAVPFLYYRHGDPYDYFRFTRFALLKLSEKHHFKVLHLGGTGGPVEILLNPISIVVNALLYRVRCKWLVPSVSRLLTMISSWLDRRVDPEQRYATNHIIVLGKVQ